MVHFDVGRRNAQKNSLRLESLHCPIQHEIVEAMASYGIVIINKLHVS